MLEPRQIQSAPQTLDLSQALFRELSGFVVGERLGGGQYRTVYACAFDPRLVVKVEEHITGRFCNVDEWNLWNAVRERPEIARWFAPVRFISASGNFLIQDRTQPITRLPRQVPNFMADIRTENMGKLKGRPVFHDFANTLIDAMTMKRFKLVDRL